MFVLRVWCGPNLARTPASPTAFAMSSLALIEHVLTQDAPRAAARLLQSNEQLLHKLERNATAASPGLLELQWQLRETGGAELWGSLDPTPLTV